MTRAPQTLWDDLVAAALLGSERRPFATPDAIAGDPLGRLLAGVGRSDPGRVLLNSAAVLDAYLRVGRRPVADPQPLPEPCPADDLPACGPGAAGHLRRMLEGEHAEVLPEWLSALGSRGRRVAEECLVALLKHALSQPALRPSIAPVLGARGRWLAARNPDWAFAVDAMPSVVDWEIGTQAARLDVLRRLRASDPDRGRSLVESTWAEDSPESRAAFLRAFADGLSMDDESFLEAALDDRRKEVRGVASSLLVRLPGSRLVARMTARAVPLLRLVRPPRKFGLIGGKAPILEADLPDAIDKAAGRDGIEPKVTAAAKAQGMGEKAWRLYQMVGAVPAATWPQSLSATPGELVAAAERGEWKLVVLKAWALAAQRFPDPAWAEALIAHSAESKSHWLAADFQGLMDVLPVDRREEIILGLLRTHRGPLNDAHPALRLLTACRHSWGPELARTTLDRIRATFRADDAPTHWQVASLLPQLARQGPPSLAIEAADGWPTENKTWPYWSQQVDRFVSLLRFRHEMLTELAS
jgi:hypothetical protein